MKIGFFLPNATFDLPGTPEVGGIEVFALTVGEAMQRAGHEVILYGGLPKRGRHYRPTSMTLRLSDYIETKAIPDLGTRFQRLVQRLHFGWKSFADVRADRPDVMILSKPFDWPVAACWRHKKLVSKVVMGFHGEDYFAGDRCFYGAVDVAFAVSRRVAGLAEKRVGIMPSVVPNPVDCHFYKPDETIAEKQNIPLLAATGRLVGWKGFHVLIEAVARLHAEGFPLRCELAGEGPEHARLVREVEQRGLIGFFHLRGCLPRDELKELLQRASAYVLPSIGLESFSIAALEAASMGLPLVLSDQVALAEALELQDRRIAMHGDAADLCRAVRQTLAEPLDAGSRQTRHARIVAAFSPESVAQRLIQLIEAKSA
jgi:glycosyltransferase involved in cell wall biosynthesis